MTQQQEQASVVPNIVMAPTLPIDPATAKPITRPTKIVAKKTTVATYSDNEGVGETIELELDAEERRLFETCKQVTIALQEGKLNNGISLNVTVRVAGGWVRDKILGLQTHDVDIALDSCSGVDFARFVKDYVNEYEQEKVGKIGVIAANPAQSKHLETATMKVYELEVDFNNLRHETYAEDSRIPQSTKIGTPLEDAYRRDFTMNSLFYNLQTQEIEDWTRHGLKDLLQTKRVVTPLEAYQTFHDDPLRVLRAIRFAIRYDMELSDDLQRACAHPQIQQELHRKVSRERVGKELEGMLTGRHANPIAALDAACKLKLAGSIFCLPPTDKIMGKVGKEHLELVPYHGESEEVLGCLREQAWKEARECLRILRVLLQHVPDNFCYSLRLLCLAVVLLPYQHLQYADKKKRIKCVAEFIMREGIKFKNKDVNAMLDIVGSLEGMTRLLQGTPETSPSIRLQAGLLLRKTKDLWTTGLLVATVVLLRKNKSSQNVDWYQRAKDWHVTILEGLKLDQIWTMKPLLNGKEAIQFLGLKGGPEVGVYTQELIQWMLMNPKGTVEEAKGFLKSYQQRRESEQDQAAQHVPKKMHI